MTIRLFLAESAARLGASGFVKRAARFAQGSALGTVACVITTTGASCLQSHPKQVLVFAAASTSDAVLALGQSFQAETNVTVRSSFGSSRDLARQIQAGAPADVFLSADTETMDGLVQAGLVQPADAHAFMSNQLVVIVPDDNANGAQAVRGPEDLKRIEHLALGDPATVPAGRYAKKWLEKAGLWGEVEKHVVPTLDVRAALAAVETGRAEAGVVYRTDAAVAKHARIAYEVPKEMSPAITYVVARVKTSQAPRAADFVGYVIGAQGRAVFQRYGFLF